MVYSYEEFKAVAKVGMMVSAAAGKESICGELLEGKQQKITNLEDSGFYINECWHNWTSHSFLETIPTTIEHCVEGDIIIGSDGDKRYCNGRVGPLIAYSYPSDFASHSGFMHWKYAQKQGWTVEGPEPEEAEELTMEEVCKELGRTIKIKK